MAMRVELEVRAAALGCDVLSAQFARCMDEADSLKEYRTQYCIPKCGGLDGVDTDLVDADSDCLYLASNSLGLMAKRSRSYVEREMDRWATLGVQGHFVGYMQWASCDEDVQGKAAKIVGAKREEVAVMSALTVNQQLLMISFYQPTPTRHKILLEAHAFPSDHYVAESQIRLKGYDPETSMRLISPRQGEEVLRTEDIVEVLEKEGDSIAVVMLPGVQYYTGQAFQMEEITRVAHDKGCLVGFDLAHAVGNIPLHVHDWGVDFACWCSYKYLSAGAGGIGGMFIHERHRHNDLPKLHGWWSHEPDTRFNMTNVMKLSPSPQCYRISNPSMFHCASLEGSLETMLSAGLCELRSKSLLLTGYLELLLLTHFPHTIEAAAQGRPYVHIITPSDVDQRGCQLSLRFSIDVTEAFSQLTRRGVMCDVRKPHVIRVAPAPLYNTFTEVHRFVQILTEIMCPEEH